MAFRPTPDAEPIPGYRLLERLGAGGYGEVWKASAPGGLHKAIKFIYGQLDDSRAGQEIKALNRIKGVRHPFLLTLERVEVIDGQLVVVTELADETLISRYESFRQQNQAGIPRDILLAYMRDIADALDYMGEKFGLQHLDIKPGNLLLVGDRVKVADFGLVKDLHGDNVTATGGVSPAYAACEFFDGRISRYSDQYSLAIVYAEMLTGVRPFPGTTTVQLALQHTTGRPMLDPLPFHDRAIILRALSKDPNERFPSCNDLVRALTDAPKPKNADLTPMPIDDSPEAAAVACTDVVTDSPPPELDAHTTAHMQTSSPALWQLASPDQKEENRETTSVRPTLFISLGGIGCATIDHLRHRLYEAFGSLRVLPMIRTIAIDTDRQELRAATERSTPSRLSFDDIIQIPLQKPDHYRARSREILRWLDRRWFYGIPKSMETEGLRPLGRLAFIDNADRIRSVLRDALIGVASTDRDSLTSVRRSNDSPAVVVVGSIGGATGSGVIIDLVHMIHDLLAELRLPTNVISTYLLHATSPNPAQKEIARANAYATLMELNHTLDPTADYPGEPMIGMEPRIPQGEIIRNCYLVHLGEDLDRDEAGDATSLVAEYLYREAATAWGQILVEHRNATELPPNESRMEAMVRSCGFYRLQYRKHEVASLLSNFCCRYLLSRWHGDIESIPEMEVDENAQGGAAYRSRWLKEIGESEAVELLARVDLQEKKILVQFETTSEGVLDGDPERHCLRKAHDVVTRFGAKAKAPEVATAILRELDVLIGSGSLPAEQRLAMQSPFEKRVFEISHQMGEEQCAKIEAWVRDTLANPQRRLKPALVATELLVYRLLARVETAQRSFEEVQAQRWHHRAKLAGEAIHSLFHQKQKYVKPVTIAELPELCRSYIRARIEELALESVIEAFRTVYRFACGLREKLVQLRQACAQQAEALKQSSDLVQGQTVKESRNLNGLELLPGKSRTPYEAAIFLIKHLSTTSFFDDLDDRIEMEVLVGKGGLWGLLNEPTGFQEVALRQELPASILSAVTGSFDHIDAASLFFETHSGITETVKQIKRLIEKARPRLSMAGGEQRLILGVPNSPPGRSLRELVIAQMPADSTLPVASQGDVIFCFEASNLPISKVAEEVIGHEVAFVQVGSRLTTRCDVNLSILPHEDTGASLLRR